VSDARPITGGCLCGALRYEANAEPLYAGFCCCGDCRKSSGSGYIGFLGFAPGTLAFTGETSMHSLPQSDGRVSQRNFCPECGGLVFGGEIGNPRGHTVYAGSLDDPARFKPTMAIFLSQKADWVALPEGLTLFERMPD